MEPRVTPVLSPAASAAALARREIWARFVHPETLMFYDCDPGPEGQRFLPYPHEIAAGIPNPAGWLTGMENGAISGPLLLEAICLEADHTPEAERPPLRREAARIWMGLERLATVARDPGYLPRAVALDGVSHYPNSSVDQYTHYVSALARYARSPLSDPGTRRRIGQILDAICARWERDGWVDRLEDGRGPAIYGDIGAHRPDRASRLLQCLLAAATFAPNAAHWRAQYEAMVEDNGRARLRPTPHQPGRATYVAQQNQLAWRLLFDLEPDGNLRAIYQERLRETAASALDGLETFREFDSAAHAAAVAASDFDWRHAYDGEPLGMDPLREGHERYRQRMAAFMTRVRERRPVHAYEYRHVWCPLEVGQIIALSGDQALLESHRPTLREMLVTYPFQQLRLSWSFYAVGFAYWLALAPADGYTLHP